MDGACELLAILSFNAEYPDEIYENRRLFGASSRHRVFLILMVQMSQALYSFWGLSCDRSFDR